MLSKSDRRLILKNIRKKLIKIEKGGELEELIEGS
jgi:hypothetical protein